LVQAPTRCPLGHALRPDRTLLRTVSCSCGRHTTWRCHCGEVIYRPVLSEHCRLLNGRASTPRDNELMADPSAFRTGYMSILLPVETGEGELRRIIRESVIRALTATGEWPIRVDVVTSTGSDDGQTKRWFVEYETGPYGQAIDQPDEPV
jgi:hypothetical protein